MVYRALLFCIVLFFCFNVSGQVKLLSIPEGEKQAYLNEAISKWQLSDLTKTADTLRFRLWYEPQIIEIWTNDMTTFKGFILNWVERANDDTPLHGKPTYISNRTPIDTAQAAQVYRYFISHQIFEILTDRKITGWGFGDDGVDLIIEYSTPALYSVKHYWTPSAFKNINEAVILQQTIEHLDTALDMRQNRINFENGLPKGLYSVGPIGFTKDLTRRDIKLRSRREKKERRLYKRL